MARKKKEEKPIEYIDDVIGKGVQSLENKIMYTNMVKTNIKDTAKIVGLQKSEISKAQDLIHTRGLGWGSDSLDKSDEAKGTGTDRISAAFRKVCDIIQIMYECGYEEEMQDYIRAAKRRGINIDVSTASFTMPGEAEKITIRTAIETISPWKDKIEQINEYMNTLAVAADHQNVTPKAKFKKLIMLTYKQNEGKDIMDKIQDELLHNEMYSNSLERLQNTGLKDDTKQEEK